MNFAISILFNSKYIEPALVTAYELLIFLDEKQPLYLLYLESKDDNDHEAMRLIVGFKNRFDNLGRIRLLKIDNNLQAFNAYHFDNSIIFKGIIPSFIKDEKFILNIDAGILPGGQFEAFLHEIKNVCISCSNNTWIIAAHCQEPQIPKKLSTLNYSKMYPAGGVLLFNAENYKKNEWHNRYVDNYNQYCNNLEYAEQELMCITSKIDEIINLPLGNERLNIFLSMDTLAAKNEIINQENIQKSIFFKCYGSFKPWKYFVLDPNKYVFTKKRARLEKDFQSTGNQLIEKNRIEFRIEWGLGFLKAFDLYSTKII